MDCPFKCETQEEHDEHYNKEVIISSRANQDMELKKLIHQYVSTLDTMGAVAIVDLLAEHLENRMVDLSSEDNDLSRKYRRMARALRLCNESEGTCQSCGTQIITLMLCDKC